MGVFSVSYQDEGDAVIAQGGLKFRAGEAALRRYFGPILEFVSLEDLIGEAVFWSLLPSTLAIWIMPLLVMKSGLTYGLIFAFLAFYCSYLLHMSFYAKALNYVVFVFGNRLLQMLGYVAFFLILWLHQERLGQGIGLLGFFLLYWIGWVELLLLLPLIPVLGSLFPLPPSDQILRNVAWHYGRRHGYDPLKWKM